MDKALHDRSAFSFGFEPIDRFLKDALTEHIRSGYLVAYAVTEEDQKSVLGFYTLNAFAVSPETIETPKRPRPPPTIPAIYIKAVAVHEDWQGKGIGQALMVHALRKSLAIADEMGSAAIVVDVLRDEAFDRRLALYAGLGFQLLDDPQNPDRVYLSMKDVPSTLGG